MRLTKIYTKVGDKGNTHLASGQKISKASLRIEAYGTVDELNSTIAMLRDLIQQENLLLKNVSLAELSNSIVKIQNELFDIGGELSTPCEKLDLKRQIVVSAHEVSRLENEIDQMNETLKPLENFVLPGGHIINSVAHLTRTICRRAEREVIKLNEHEEVREDLKIYLNRLSDWLFVLSRYLSKLLNVPETLWQQKRP